MIFSEAPFVTVNVASSLTVAVLATAAILLVGFTKIRI